MKNNYPEKLRLSIDEKTLVSSFMLNESVTIWVIGIFPVMCIFPNRIPFIFGIFAYDLNFHRFLAGLSCFIAIGLTSLIALGLISLLYQIIWGKRPSVKRASKFFVEVDGAYLRIVDGKSDRKIHFRQIGDYEAILDRKDSSLPGGIKMRLTSLNNQYLTIHGVIDVVKTRDMLAEIDAQRE